MNVLDFFMNPILIQNIGVSLLTVLIVVPYVQKRTVKSIWKKLNGSKGGKLAVDGKIDSAILNRAVKDLLSPENPVGAVLTFFPSVQSYLKEKPSSVVGFIRLLDNIGNISNLKANMEALSAKPQQLNTYNDYSKYK